MSIGSLIIQTSKLIAVCARSRLNTVTKGFAELHDQIYLLTVLRRGFLLEYVDGGEVSAHVSDQNKSFFILYFRPNPSLYLPAKKPGQSGQKLYPMNSSQNGLTTSVQFGAANSYERL